MVKGVPSVTAFISHVDVQCRSTIGGRDSMLHLLLCQKPVDCIYMGVFLGSLFVPSPRPLSVLMTVAC